MNQILEQISICIQKGKVDSKMAYPPEMKGMPGADELTSAALDGGFSANDLLSGARIRGMGIVGDLFREKRLFVPQVLMSAMAMKAAMVHLKPFFSSGELKQKGTFIIGTVAGDLHDIGKNLTAMMIEGAGWRVIDLGTDVKTEQFLEVLNENGNAVVGLSALLTTTMEQMERSVKAIREHFPENRIVVGGAPVNSEFAKRIGASLYAPNPQVAVEYINSI